jgi:chemotaxis protein CheZ
MNTAAPRHEELLHLLDDAIRAGQSGDQSQHRATIDALVEWRSRPLQTVLARLAQELSDSLFSLPGPSAAEIDLASELPDARSRLDYVVQMAERAAHRTLDGVDSCRKHIDALVREPLPGSCAPIVAGMRADLSTMALAQEYQDLGGQIIRRVIGIVHRVESALSELGVKPPTGPRRDGGLAGPAIPDVDHGAVSQSDADMLLSGLGL